MASKKNLKGLIYIGTAGWSVPTALTSLFPGEGQHLIRYSQQMNAVEINSSFYRNHQQKTYRRWASVTPSDFRFSVKLPKSISHLKKLQKVTPLLDQFFDEIAGLQDKLGPILVQLPPSLVFDESAVSDFFGELREKHSSEVVCEPRHVSWFESKAQILLETYRITQVAADPVTYAAAAQPGGWLGTSLRGKESTIYWRLHGSPRMYWSSYDHDHLCQWREKIKAYSEADIWCIFDNTAGGAALQNALEFKSMFINY